MQPKYSISKEAEINLSIFQITHTNLNVNENLWGDRNASVGCELSVTFNSLTKDEEEDMFGLQFELNLHNEDNTFLLSVTAFAGFVVKNLKVDDEFLKSHFVIGNAPAIVFPYLRTFVTNFCQSSGYSPIMIPAFNFNHIQPID